MNAIRTLCAAVLALACADAGAAGMATHAFMADTGRQGLPEGVLKQILTVHRPSLIAGAIYPDGGYGSGNAFPPDRDMAEHAHWGHFHVAFIQYLRSIGCGAQAAALLPVGGSVADPAGTIDLSGLTDECGSLIAFAFGDAAHGITDETWDAQFEPEVRTRHEDPNLAEFLDAQGFWGPLAPGPVVRQLAGDNYRYLYAVWSATPMNGIEYAMDVIGTVEHNLAINAPALVFPPATHLVKVYESSGQPVTLAQIERGNLFARGAVQAEADTAALDYERVRAHMPYAANNYFLDAGGVVPSGRIVTGMYQYLWSMLVAPPRQTAASEVVGHYPWHGQTQVNLRPEDGSGWTAHRWMHVFFSAPLDPDSIEAPGSFRLVDAKGHAAPITVIGGHGWSRQWSHSARIRLDAPLKRNMRYTAVVTRNVKDWSGRKLARPYMWQFTTAP